MKYFICSDIHSFYSEFKEALKKAGFDVKKEHCLIILGDLFDRGAEAVKLYNYLKKLPENKLILIKGNHEELLLNLLEKDSPDYYDFTNGTLDTILQFTKGNLEDIKNWKQLCTKFKKLNIYNWLTSKKWLNYFELNNLILTHSFIPIDTKKNKVLKNWRKAASEDSWSDARWLCPYKFFDLGLFDKEIKHNKTLVCGHWSAASAHQHYYSDFFTYDIFHKSNLIMLDSCTALSKKVNILVVDENGVCFNGNTNSRIVNNIKKIETKPRDYCIKMR